MKTILSFFGLLFLSLNGFGQLTFTVNFNSEDFQLKDTIAADKITYSFF